jgi:hypothetical protein
MKPIKGVIVVMVVAVAGSVFMRKPYEPEHVEPLDHEEEPRLSYMTSVSTATMSVLAPLIVSDDWPQFS